MRRTLSGTLLLAASALAIATAVGAQSADGSPRPVVKPGHLAPDGPPRPVPRPGSLKFDIEPPKPRITDVPPLPTPPSDTPQVIEAAQVEDLPAPAPASKEVAPEEVSESVAPEVVLPDPQEAKPARREIFVLPDAFLREDADAPSFGDALNDVVNEMSQSRDSVSVANARMKLALLHLRHGHYAEALSAVERIEPAYLTRSQRQNLLAMRGVAEIMAPVAAVISTPYLLDEAGFDAWDDQPLWRTVHAIRSGEGAEDAEALEAAYEILAEHYPRPYKIDLYPLLLEEALRTSRWSLAKKIATELAASPHLQKGSSYDFLLGYAAHKAERLLDAFDAYRKASQGSDVYAQRARLGLVEIGIESEVMPEADAETILEANRYMWRGDGYEIDLLLKLADLKLAKDDRSGAMLALGQVFTRYPEAPEAEAAETVARKLLGEFYKAGVSGDISLSTFTEGHRKIEPVFHFVEGFERHHANFAETLLKQGATISAAQEFGIAAEYLQVAQDLGLWEIEPKDIQDLLLRKADAEWQGGRSALAATTLAPLEPLGEKYLDDRLNILKAEVFSDLDNPEEVVATEMNDRTPRYVRMLAEAYYAQGDHAKAVEHFAELRAEYPQSYEDGDAISHVLSAYRAGNFEAVLSVVEEFPEIMQSKAWGEVAAGLNATPVPLSPLNDKAAQARIAQAEEAMAAIREATAKPADMGADTPDQELP